MHKSYGQTLTISKEADRVIFGGPSRKPTFTELCNVNLKQRDGSEGCNIVASARPLAKQKENGRGTDVTEEDQRGRSVESTPTKGSGHQRTPTPHSNLIFGSRTTGSARVPAKEEVAPWTSNESTTAAGTTAARPIKSVGEHPPRSDSLRNIHAPDAQAETTSTSMMTRDGPHDVKAAVEPRKMPQSVAESSFEAFLPKAKSANVDVRLSNKPAPGQMLPEKQLPEPATGQSAQATPADSSTASSSRGEQDSTFSCRIARRDTDSTATGSQLTENGVSRQTRSMLAVY